MSDAGSHLKDPGVEGSSDHERRPGMVRGILFDYGNTLVRIRDGADVLSGVLGLLGREVDAGKASEAVAAMGELWHRLYEERPRGQRWSFEIRVHCADAGLSAIGIAEDSTLARQVAEKWESHEVEGPYSDVIPTLKVLAEMKLRLGVLSQTRMLGPQLKEKLDSMGIGMYLGGILTSEDAGYDKPDPRLFHAGAEMIGLGKSELWYVGNRYHEDVVGARDAGITPVLVERRARSKSRDCMSVPSLTALPSLLGCWG